MIEVARSNTDKWKVETDNIVAIMKNLNNNKKAGNLGVSNEMYKHSVGTIAVACVVNIITCLIQFDVKPKSWNVGIIMTLIKDVMGPTDQTDNSRPITISDVIAIIWEMYILNIYEKTSNLQIQQFGFRKYSSTTHAIYVLRESIRIRQLEKKPTYVLFLDFSKAFDKVNRKKLMVKMFPYYHPKVWLALVNYYSIATIKVMDETNNKWTTIETKSGVKQGGPFSPVAFDEYIDEMIKIIISSDKVIKINGLVTGIVIYADDTSLACNNYEDLR